MNRFTRQLPAVLLPFITGMLGASPVTADLTRIADPAVWRAQARSPQLVDEDGRKFVRLESRADLGIAWLAGSNFTEGTIEVELRGKNVVGQSFVGVAFRGTDDKTFDAVFFRPFNFTIDDPARRLHAVQYVSHPQFPWFKLRADHPGEYEKPVSPPPDPEGWFRARIVIAENRVSVFVNEAAQASLVVQALSPPRGGMVGLWVGTNSGGDFASLRLEPKSR